MSSCWKQNENDRPSFAELRKDLGVLLEENDVRFLFMKWLVKNRDSFGFFHFQYPGLLKNKNDVMFVGL